MRSRVQSNEWRYQWDYNRHTLTPTELDVLADAAEGLRYKEIAARHGISRQTVKQHLAACRYKLNARNTVNACCIAVRCGLIN